MKHNFEISYTQQGDYLLPDLRLPEQPKVEIGVWGAGVRWTPLPQAEAPTEPTVEASGIYGILSSTTKSDTPIC